MMLRSAISLGVAVLCWTKSTFGFVPLHSVSRTCTSSLYDRALRVSYSNMMLEEQKEELRSRLPSLNRQQMTKYEVEFRKLLKNMLYTSEEMSAVTNPRLRVLFEGVAASYYEPAVYRAFEVLYEDFMPLRVAGRLIYGKLQSVIDISKAYRQEQLNRVATQSGLPLEVVGTFWGSFVKLAGDREMTTDRLNLILERGTELGYFQSSLQESMSMINPGQNERLSFEELIAGLMTLSSDMAAENIQEVLAIETDLPCHFSQLDDKRAKYNQRYDDMLTKFGVWKEFIPAGEGRRLDILRGCFVGSESPKVVEALRVIYTDYTALRMSGDWIFQVVSTLMNAAMRRRQGNAERA